MAEEQKKHGINLNKGSKISLEKEGKKLERICVGLNWGAIEKKRFFGLFKEKETVDLDGSVSLFYEDKSTYDTVYYHHLRSDDGAVIHSGDDRVGDVNNYDEFDNEVIQIDLKKVHPNVKTIVFYLNSYKEQNFADIPYSKIRIFEGTPNRVDSIFATLNLSSDASFKGYISMVMGKLVRKNDNWEFVAIGEPVPTKGINETIAYIKEKYL
jgi:tellurium resistance protein TerZ